MVGARPPGSRIDCHYGQCSDGKLTEEFSFLSSSSPLSACLKNLYFGLSRPSESACLPCPQPDSKSSKLRADIDRCLVCIPHALMADGRARGRRSKLPSPLRRPQNVPPPSPVWPSTRLQPTVFDGGVGVVGGGKRVAFQNSFRVRQRLESSVAAVIAWENKHEESALPLPLSSSPPLYFNVRH